MDKAARDDRQGRGASGRLLPASRLHIDQQAAMVDVICYDKTGTLTRNELVVSAIRPAKPDHGEADVLDFAALANSSEGRDPIDSVIRTVAADGRGHGHPSLKVARFTPFDPATTLAEANAVDAGREIRVIKGAPAVVAKVAPMTPAAEKDLAAFTLAMDFIKLAVFARVQVD